VVPTVEQAAIEQLIARHPTRTVNAGAGTIAYRETGAGAPLVLLHGISSGSGSWVHQLDKLAGRYRIIAWDAPGYGGSTRLPAESPMAADYSAALTSLFDALKLPSAVIVGHSLGAIIAGSFAAQAADRVTRLLLLDPARGYGSAPAETRASKLDQRLAAMEKLGPAEHARQRSAALLGPNASQAARELVIWNASRIDRAGYAQAARMLAQADLCADAPRYEGPVLVACGSEDQITPEAACREVARAFPSAKYRSLAGLGHVSYIDDPTAVNELLIGFTSPAERV
jgi:pimeloyl-ACP methyl ester carboxylesterase